jgi:hypothetical protein
MIVGAYKYTGNNCSANNRTWISNINYRGKVTRQQIETKLSEQKFKVKKQKHDGKKDVPALSGISEDAVWQRLEKIKAQIENKSKGCGWMLDGGGRSIRFDSKEYKVPSGIESIYTIAQQFCAADTKVGVVSALKKIYRIAKARKAAHHTFLFFGRRSADTRYFYDKIADLAASGETKNTAAKETRVFPVRQR